MLLTSYNAAAVWLLNHEPNWFHSPRLTLTRPAAEVQRSLTGREARAVEAAELRCSLEWESTLTAAGVLVLQHALQAMQDEPLLVPVWPMRTAGSEFATSPLQGGITIAWDEDWTDYAINPAEPSDYDYAAPALLARFKTRPQPGLISDRVADVAFEVIEDSAFAEALAPLTAAWSTFSDRPIFPLPLEWSSEPSAGGAEATVESERIGPGRREARTFYPQNPERFIAGRVLAASLADVADLLAWWRAAGNTRAHWLGGQLFAGELGGDAAAADDTITLAGDAATLLGSNRYLWLDTIGQEPELVHVTALAGAEVTLAAPLTAAHAAHATNVSCAVLARHLGDELELVFESPACAWAKLRWREVTPEYTPALGEAAGETLGELPAKAWLFEFTEDYAGSSVVTRLTNHERTLTSAGDVEWTHRPSFDVEGELRQSLDLARDELTLRARWWAGCPFRHFLPGQLAARVLVAVYEATVADDAAEDLQLLFSGQVSACTFDGAIVSAKVGGPNALFDRKLPGDLFQPQCNAQLFDARCGLDLAAWRFTAAVVSAVGTVLTVGTLARENTEALPDGFGVVHYFALGYVEWESGGLTLRAPIYESAALAGGEIALTTRNALGLAAATAVVLVPGCTKRRECCGYYHATNNPEGKYANYANFRGFPGIPDRAPQFTPPKRSNTAQGKK